MNKRGRPRKAAADRHENRLELNLNDFWLHELQAYADEHHLPLRVAARSLLQRQLKNETTLTA